MVFIFQDRQQLAELAMILVPARLGMRHMVENERHCESTQEGHGTNDFRHRLREELDVPSKPRDARTHGLGVRERQTALAVCLDAKTGDAAVFEVYQFRIGNCRVEQREPLELSTLAR